MNYVFLYAYFSALASSTTTFQLPDYVPAPAPTAGAKLERRKDDDCLASITDKILSIGPPSATGLQEWLSLQPYDIDACTLSAPASLSSDLFSYASSISNFWEGAESRFNEVDTMCGVDELKVAFTNIGCTETQKAEFTSYGGTGTETVDLPSGTRPSGTLRKTSETGEVSDTSAAVGQKSIQAMSLAGLVWIAFTAVFAP